MITTTTTKTIKPARPLSPHLQIYKPQLTSGMSIFHRITGVALAVGMPVFVVWLVVTASNAQLYGRFMGLFHTVIGQILLAGWTFSFLYHFFCGIRHLLWDAGIGLNIKAVYSTGRIALALAVLTTLYLWFKYYGIAP